MRVPWAEQAYSPACFTGDCCKAGERHVVWHATKLKATKSLTQNKTQEKEQFQKSTSAHHLRSDCPEQSSNHFNKAANCHLAKPTSQQLQQEPGSGCTHNSYQELAQLLPSFRSLPVMRLTTSKVAWHHWAPCSPMLFTEPEEWDNHFQWASATVPGHSSISGSAQHPHWR